MTTITIDQPVDLPKLNFTSVSELWETLMTLEENKSERTVPLATELAWEKDIQEEIAAGRTYDTVEEAMQSLLNDPVEA